MNKIQTRLLTSFLLIALLPLVGLSAATYLIFDRALYEQVTLNLRAVANAKTHQIEEYALERKRDVAALARSPGLADLVQQLDTALANGNPRGTDFDAALTLAESYVSYYVGEGAYTDLYLLDADANLLYSRLRTDEIGMNFLEGERANTTVARVFDRARTLLETEISDFGDDVIVAQPTALIAAPILQNGIVIGVVALQIDNQALYQVVADSLGLDETGETVVGSRVGTGQESAIRLSAPLRLGDDSDLLYRPLPPSTFPLLAVAAQGVRREGQSTDYRGVDVLYVTRYLPSLRWGLVVKTDSAEAFAPITAVRTLVIGLLMVTLGVVAVIAVMIANTITQPLRRLTGIVRQFEQGDLAVRADEQGARDEVGALAHGFNALAGQLSSTINSLEDRVQQRTQALEEQAISLRDARAAADTANQSKSIFLANMSHELRTPMNAILGFTQLIDRDPSLNEHLRDYLKVVQRSGDHLLLLINDVLEMSRIEAGQMSVNAAPFDLHALLKGVQELFQLRALEKNLRLLIEVTEEVPQFIKADESKLRQILINLIGNALKFTHEGGITVRVGLQAKHLYFEVEDTGDGISPSDQQRLFQAFVQTDTGIKSQQGTGLGLAITRQFVALLGGQISLRSEPEHGSIFFFDIPFEEAVAGAESVAPKARVIGIESPQGKVYRVLVADDKWENRRLMIEWMKIAGFEVREVANGKEAVEVWLEWEPHLIWMDMRMPVMDGYEATRTIKSSTKGQATVIIALTASAFEHERAIVLSAGCDDFVRKPAREALIFQKIEQHLGITFKYAEPIQPIQLATTQVELTPAALMALSAEQRSALKNAADEVDINAADTVIADIRQTHPAIADSLAVFVKQYRFDHIQSLLDDP